MFAVNQNNISLRIFDVVFAWGTSAILIPISTLGSEPSLAFFQLIGDQKFWADYLTLIIHFSCCKRSTTLRQTANVPLTQHYQPHVWTSAVWRYITKQFDSTFINQICNGIEYGIFTKAAEEKAAVPKQ